MDARSIGELTGTIIKDAIGLARLQQWVGTIEEPAARKWLVMFLYEHGTITADEAEILIEHNALEAA